MPEVSAVSVSPTRGVPVMAGWPEAGVFAGSWPSSLVPGSVPVCDGAVSLVTAWLLNGAAALPDVSCTLAGPCSVGVV